MVIEFAEILHDLELKRAAALAPGDRPVIDVAAAVDHEAAPDVAVRDEDGIEQPYTPTLAGALVADALSTLAAAAGEQEADTAAGRAIVRAATRRVGERLAGLAQATITTADLSALVEAALIASGQYEVAKALVVQRVPPLGAQTGTLRLIRRSGDVVPWSTAKIEAAVRKAFLSLQSDPAPAGVLAQRVAERAGSLGVAYVPIETVQDIVQEELVLGGHMRAAERYIVYRAERAMLRAQEPRPEPPAIPVLEADGSESLWHGEDLRQRIAFAAIGLDLGIDAGQIERELRRSIRPGVARADLRRLVILNARSLVERDSDFSPFAGRILLSYVYEEALDWDVVRDGIGGLRDAHRRALRPLLERGVAIKRFDARLLEYDLDRLAAALDPSADLDFDFLGLQTLYDRYLTVDKTGAAPVRIEAPQLFWMRVAMGVCLGESGEDREARVLDLYAAYKERRFCSSTPTLFNAGTPSFAALVLLPLLHRGHPLGDRRPGDRRERDVLEVGRRAGRFVDRGARHRRAHRVHERREPGRGPVPEDAQRPARGGQPGRQAGGLGLRVPGGLAQRHPRVPRAAPQHRRRAPPHA